MVGDNFSEVCEQIISLRKQMSKNIWVLSEKCPKLQWLIYFQLGANGTFYNQEHADELALIFMRILKRKKYSEASNSSREGLSSGKELAIEFLPSISAIKLANSDEIELTKMEYSVLEYLYQNKETTVSCQELIQAVWGNKEVDNIYLVVNLMFHLRKKLKLNKRLKERLFIKMIRSKGYRLFIQ